MKYEEILEEFLKYPDFKIFTEVEGKDSLTIRLPNGKYNKILMCQAHTLYIWPKLNKSGENFVNVITYEVDLIEEKDKDNVSFSITKTYIKELAEYMIQQVKDFKIRNKIKNIEEDFI